MANFNLGNEWKDVAREDYFIFVIMNLHVHLR